MFGVCLRYASDYDEAQDLLQEAFIKIYTKLKQYKGKGAFEGWIRRIVVNTALERLRSKIFTEEIGEAVKFEFSHSDDLISNLSTQELMKMVQELSPQYRTVFNLYAIEGYNHKEIAELLNISEGTSKSNLSRARVILQGKVIKYNSVSEKIG